MVPSTHDSYLSPAGPGTVQDITVGLYKHSYSCIGALSHFSSTDHTPVRRTFPPSFLQIMRPGLHIICSKTEGGNVRRTRARSVEEKRLRLMVATWGTISRGKKTEGHRYMSNYAFIDLLLCSVLAVQFQDQLGTNKSRL